MLNPFGFFSRSKAPVDCPIHPVLLLVLDGFGIAPPGPGNAVYLAGMPNWSRFLQEYPHGMLVASGESVGLPTVEVGNTEVGHLTMGAGRVMYQDLKRVSMALDDGSFEQNQAFLKAFEHVHLHGSRLHILGLVSKGSVHSDLGHLYGLIDLCERYSQRFYLHAITDGRDSSPTSGKDVLAMVEQRLQQGGMGSIASVMGRYYAMDRDRRWERTEKAYRVLVMGEGESAASVHELMERAYAGKITDEFVQPTVIAGGNQVTGSRFQVLDQEGNQVGPGVGTESTKSMEGIGNQPVNQADQANLAHQGKQLNNATTEHVSNTRIADGDAVIFFNFRKDRPKQLAMAFVEPEFEHLKAKHAVSKHESEADAAEAGFTATFKRPKSLKNLFFVTMTEYDEAMPVSAVAFPPVIADQPLSYVIAVAGLKQLRMAESEKQRFVTYYFDGLREEPPEHTEVVIIPSPKVATYDRKPEMSVHKLGDEFIKRVGRCEYHFAMMNFANADMVGHTGSIPAVVEALGHVDQVLGQIETVMLQYGGTVLITADHGNCEEMLDFPKESFFYTSDQGKVNTKHSGNLVPVVILSQAFKGKPVNLGQGALADVAPTILGLLGLKPAPGMTGRNLLNS